MKFSIVVACAPDREAEVVESLKKVDYPKKQYEVILIKGLNPSENRNNGIKKAKGEIIGFIDDDAIVDKEILKRAEMYFNYVAIDIIGGPQLTPESDEGFAKISGYALENFFGTFNMSKRYKKSRPDYFADESSLTSANCFVRKKVFDKVGGFNVNLFPGEDPEFFTRAKKACFGLVYAPDVVVYHKRRPTPSGLFKQFYNYGKARLKVAKILNEKPKPFFFIPSLFVVYILLLPLLLAISLVFIFPISIYVMIAFIVGLNIKPKYALDLVVCFFILHFSYGLGVLGYLSE